MDGDGEMGNAQTGYGNDQCKSNVTHECIHDRERT